MAKGFKASDYHLMETSVSFETDAEWVKALFDRCEFHCRKNLAVYTDKLVLREGSDYDGVWLETQPMGGEMYAKRNMEAALNNQLIFMENQRLSGRLPGMIKFQKPFLLQVFYDWLQGFCFPTPALKMYYLIGRDPEYLKLLYRTLKGYDDYLWTYRDSDGDGCLETWCVWDTAEDNSNRFLMNGIEDGGWGGEDAPYGVGKLPYESMDIMSYSCEAREVLGTVSDLLQNREGETWRKKAEDVRKKIREYLWIEEKDACFDRDCDNRFMDVLTHNNLRCMYYGSFSQEMADRFIKKHLLNPEEFWTKVPLPSIAVNDPAFRNINFNNWGGQPQGLTYQRAIQALEKYGHAAEIRMLGKIWISLLSSTGTLRQQYDPFTGAPCVTRSEGLAPEGEETERYKDVVTLGPDGYGPTCLAALEYISLLYGVNIACEQVKWSCVQESGNLSYTQHMYDRDYTLKAEGEFFSCFIGGRELFRASKGVQVTTDLTGKITDLAGIEDHPVHLVFCPAEGGSSEGEIRPNEFVKPEGDHFSEIRQIAFDFPYKKS